MDRPNKFGVSMFVHHVLTPRERDCSCNPGCFMLTAIGFSNHTAGRAALTARCCAADPYSPDSFLGEFLFRVERSSFAEAGG